MRLIDAYALFDNVLEAYGIIFDESEANLFMKMIMRAPTVNPESLQPQWIPVTDRLPEIHNTVLVFARYNGQSANSMHIKHDAITTNFRDSRGEWIYMGKGYHVEAWMPLPEPYNPEGLEDRNE